MTFDCSEYHRKLISGLCPWCRKEIWQDPTKESRQSINFISFQQFVELAAVALRGGLNHLLVLGGCDEIAVETAMVSFAKAAEEISALQGALSLSNATPSNDDSNKRDALLMAIEEIIRKVRKPKAT